MRNQIRGQQKTLDLFADRSVWDQLPRPVQEEVKSLLAQIIKSAAENDIADEERAGGRHER
jgi:hypothetical protein